MPPTPDDPQASPEPLPPFFGEDRSPLGPAARAQGSIAYPNFGSVHELSEDDVGDEILTHKLDIFSPRVWTVFIAIVALIGAMLLGQVLAVALLISIYVAQGLDPDLIPRELPHRIATPAAYITIALFTQIAVGLTAWIAAKKSPTPTTIRLGFSKPRLSYWTYLLLMVGSLLPLAAGVGSAFGLSLWIPADNSVISMYDHITPAMAIPFVLSVSLAAGFCEELFWRGYVQRRFLSRWSPWAAIPLTALLFGLFHVTPHAAINAFIVALWLGVLAYKTESIWPAVCCHAFINVAWTGCQIGQRLGDLPQRPSQLVLVSLLVVTAIAFCASVGVIFSNKKPRSLARVA